MTANTRVDRTAWDGVPVALGPAVGLGEEAVGLGEEAVELSEGATVDLTALGGRSADRAFSVGAGTAATVRVGSRSTRKASRTTLTKTNPPMATFDQLPFEKSGMRSSLVVLSARGDRAGPDGYRCLLGGTVGVTRGTMSTEPGPVYTILCVCTGNVCRSPAAERLLAARLGPDVRVRSAGTLGLVGRAIEPPMAAHLTALGVPEVGFAARRMTATDVGEADLVLGMTREHRGAAVELAPAAVRRAFTLLEFARLLELVGPDELPDGTLADRLRAAVPLANGRRRRVTAPDVDDVIDPYRRAAQAYQQSFTAIRGAVETITERVHPLYSGKAST